MAGTTDTTSENTDTDTDEVRSTDDESTPTDEAATEDREQSGDVDADDDADDDADGDEAVSEPVDQTPALREGGTLNLGLCHFDAERPASILATRTDGTGWIAVCEDHTKDAEEQGFVLEDSSESSDSSDSSDSSG